VKPTMPQKNANNAAAYLNPTNINSVQTNVGMNG